MGSLLIISNKALRKISVREIASLTQSGEAAARCNAAVRDSVKEVIRKYPFSFTTVWDTLPLLATAPPFGYTYAYQLPNSAVKLFDISDSEDLTAPRISFDLVRGNKIYTDASPCYARYGVYAEADLTTAPPDFINACAFNLGAEIAGPLTKTEMIPVMEQMYRFYLNEAMLSDAAGNNERKKDENRMCSILTAREYPGSVGDNNYGEYED